MELVRLTGIPPNWGAGCGAGGFEGAGGGGGEDSGLSVKNELPNL